jgi:hypothetical protein
MKWIFVILFFTSHSLAQKCRYDVNIGNFTASVQSVAQVLPHTFSISRPTNSSQSNCPTYYAYFAKGQANSYQRRAYSRGNSLRYNLYRTVNMGNILKDFGDASSNEFLFGSLPQPNTPSTSTMYVEVLDQVSTFSIPPGVYNDTLPINIYALRNNGDIEYQRSAWFTLSFTISRYAEVSIIPVNSPHDSSATTYVMNFGSMVPYQELEADLRVRANVPYGIWVSSLNGGQLRKSPNTTPVPYQIRVGHSNYFTPPTWNRWVLNEGCPSNAAGRAHRVRVKLGNFASLDDGDYEEAITITVQAY